MIETERFRVADDTLRQASRDLEAQGHLRPIYNIVRYGDNDVFWYGEPEQRVWLVDYAMDHRKRRTIGSFLRRLERSDGIIDYTPEEALTYAMTCVNAPYGWEIRSRYMTIRLWRGERTDVLRSP